MVPDGKNVPVISVRIGQGKMMMNFVKMWGDKDGRKYLFNPWSGTNIGMSQVSKETGHSLV